MKYETKEAAVASPEGRRLYEHLNNIAEEAQAVIGPSGHKPQYFGSQAYLEYKVWLILNSLATA